MPVSSTTENKIPLALRRILNYKKYLFKLSLIIIIFLIILKFFIFLYYFDKREKYITFFEKPKPLKLNYVIVHLDLKGAPPKLAYLKSLLPILKENGANGLLIEYEDMFPYENELEHIPSKHCYKRDELGDFLRTAADKGFEIIPLIQTYSHMEHVLKLKEFADLRQDPTNAESICPKQKKSQQLLKAMLYQVLKFHVHYSNTTFIHIGCDKVEQIITCDICRKANLTKEQIYAKHIEYLSKTIKYMFPKITVLIWNDILNTIGYAELHSLSHYVRPVLWDFTPYLLNMPTKLYENHHLFHNYMWAASAFKGVDGVNDILPNLQARCENILSWMELLKRHYIMNDFSVQGIFLTGWSRYSHFSELCELLPSSIHSLIFNLLIINEFKKHIIYSENDEGMKAIYYNVENEFRNKFRCNCEISINNFQNYCCQYNESRLHSLLNSYISKDALFDEECGVSILSDALEKKTFKANMYEDDKLIEHIYKTFNICIKDLTVVELNLIEELKLYFDEHVINEYINYQITKRIKGLSEKFKSFQIYSEI